MGCPNLRAATLAYRFGQPIFGASGSYQLERVTNVVVPRYCKCQWYKLAPDVGDP